MRPAPSFALGRGLLVRCGLTPGRAFVHPTPAVTKLLVSTRELLSSLTDWSQGKINENDVRSFARSSVNCQELRLTPRDGMNNQVSDYYVKLGNDFNVAVSAFTALDIPMQCVNHPRNAFRMITN